MLCTMLFNINDNPILALFMADSPGDILVTDLWVVEFSANHGQFIWGIVEDIDEI